MQGTSEQLPSLSYFLRRISEELVQVLHYHRLPPTSRNVNDPDVPSSIKYQTENSRDESPALLTIQSSGSDVVNSEMAV